MAVMVDVDDLVSAGQIAERAGVTVAAVSNWSARNVSFPAPVRDECRSRLWLWSEVQVWLGATRRAGSVW